MPTENNIERRIIPLGDMELRVEGEGKETRIKGYAAKFNKWSENLGFFREKIAPGAFERVLAQDVRCLKNHDPNLILGRTINKTLSLTQNSVGLQFDNLMPDTTTGRDTAEEIRRGDITGCSFAFTVSKDEWFEDEEHNITRTINEVDSLFDVGPVTYPAYPDTSVAVRSLDKWRGSQKQAEPEKPEIKPEEAKAEEKPAEPRIPTLAEQRECEKNLRKAGRILLRNKKK